MEPFIGEIRLFATPFVPEGWALCNGQLVSSGEFRPLFAVIGNRYGGDAHHFALPNLQGRTARSAVRNGDTLPGTVSGTRSYTLSESEIPSHNHQVSTYAVTGDQYFGEAPTAFGYIGRYAIKGTSTVAESFVEKSIPTKMPLHLSTVAPEGGSQPHENMQPFFALRYCIALTGIFPMRT